MAPRWTAKLEYLFTGYRNSSVNFPAAAIPAARNRRRRPDRVGFNYQFDNGGAPANFIAPGWPDQDRVNFHAQMTLTEQANAISVAKAAGSMPTSINLPVRRRTAVWC